jgi:25S rRNA (uracil2634-N3)-methyltransferase
MVLFSIDARKLGTPSGGGKELRHGFPRQTAHSRSERHSKASDHYNRNANAGGPWDIICFNFPHVGGLSTDINRQVRANQELLVAFFKACIPLLSASGDSDGDDGSLSGYNDDTDLDSGSDTEEEGDVDVRATAKKMRRAGPGQILVTLFEGEPYTLWNIRDLARHAGLRVVTSFRFPWHCYPGYMHARTLGVIEGRHGERGGWRGEDREARMFVFEVKGEETGNLLTSAKRKRTKWSGSEESE